MADGLTEATLGPDGLLRCGPLVLPASIGRTGITRHKQEGDGATPAGRLPLRRILYRADRIARPATPLPVEPIAPDDGWCDDPAHPAYNRPIRLPHEARHEALWRGDHLYDLIVVLGWNDDPIRPGVGSAIFLHPRAPDGGPTEGCVALALGDLRALLALAPAALMVAA